MSTLDTPLSPEAVEAALQERPGWSVEDGALHRAFAFDDFVQAFAFMTRAAFAAERLGHHPDWCNTYGRVVVNISHHDAGGITERCFLLARAMDEAS